MLEPSGRLGRFINSVVRPLREAQSLPGGFDVSRFAGQCGHPGTHREGVREASWVFFIFVNSSWLPVTTVLLAVSSDTAG